LDASRSDGLAGALTAEAPIAPASPRAPGSKVGAITLAMLYGLFNLTYGTSRIVMPGDDVTLVGISNMLVECLRARELLSDVGVSAEIIDPLEGDTPDVVLERLQDSLREYVAEEAERTWLLPRLATLLGITDAAGTAATFERDDLGLRQRADRHDAGARRSAVNEDRAGAALTEPAAEFGSVELKIVAQHVEQRRVQIGCHAVHRAVHLETDNHDLKPPLRR